MICTRKLHLRMLLSTRAGPRREDRPPSNLIPTKRSPHIRLTDERPLLVHHAPHTKPPTMPPLQLPQLLHDGTAAGAGRLLIEAAPRIAPDTVVAAPVRTQDSQVRPVRPVQHRARDLQRWR